LTGRRHQANNRKGFGHKLLKFILSLQFNALIMKLTLIIKKGKNGFMIGQIKEFPAVFTQGLSIDEIKENIQDVLEMYLEDVREQYKPDGEMILEEELSLV